METVTFALLVCFIWARYFATDVIYAVRGEAERSPRHQERMARINAGRPVLADAGVRLVDATADVVRRYANRPRERRGLFGYLADLKDDAFAAATERRRRKRAEQPAPSSTTPSSGAVDDGAAASGPGPDGSPDTPAGQPPRPPRPTPPPPPSPPPPGVDDPRPPDPEGVADEPPTVVKAKARRLDEPGPQPTPPPEPLALPPAPPRDDNPQIKIDGSTTMTMASADVTTTVDGDISPEEALRVAQQYTDLGRALIRKLEALIGALRANKVGDQVIAKFAQMQDAAGTFVGQGEQAMTDFQQHIQLADQARGVEHSGGERYLGMAAANRDGLSAADRGGAMHLGIQR